MDFSKKLQELRKQKGLTQEQLAQSLYVSRTAISKWESGRGYPSIESLKQISKTFSITVDELLSGDELITLAEQNTKQRENHYRDLVFGLLDVSALMLLFLPFFAQRVNGVIKEVSLLSLTAISPYLKIVYFIFIALITLLGVLTLALQRVENKFWLKIKNKTSIILNLIGALIFTVSLQPYAFIFWFSFLTIKVLIFMKN